MQSAPTAPNKLAALFTPTGEARFIEHFAAKQPLLLKGEVPDAASLFSLADINRLFASGALTPPDASLFRNGMALPELAWCNEDGSVNAAALADTLRKGTSAAMSRIGGMLPGLARLEQQVERVVRARTLINAYLTCGKGSAFAPHYDNHDVLIVQVLGSKRWEFFGSGEPPAQSRIKMKPDAPCDHEPSWSETLELGDLLFVPRGTWHAATVDDGSTSLHLTVTMISPTGADYLSWLAGKLAADDLVSSDLPFADPAAYAARLYAFVQEQSGNYGPKEFLAELDSTRGLVQCFALGQPAPDAGSVYHSALRRPLTPRTDADSSRIVEAGGRQYRLNPAMALALEALDSAPHGLTSDALCANLAGRYDSGAVMDALTRLLEKGLVLRG